VERLPELVGNVINQLAWLKITPHIFPMLADERSSPEQIEAFRRMTPEQRWRAAHRLYWTMRRHKAAFLRSQHPEWPEQKVEEEVRQIFCHART
jgi:hypothetical protein